MGLNSQPSTPRFTGRKRPLESTPSPEGENTPTYRQEPEASTSSSQTIPDAQMTRDAHEHGIATARGLMDAAQNSQLRRLIEEEEEEAKAAQDVIFHFPVKEEEEDGPSEAASKGKSENEVEHVGSPFLGVVLDAIKATEKNVYLDKKMLVAQNLSMDVGWVAQKALYLEVAKRR